MPSIPESRSPAFMAETEALIGSTPDIRFWYWLDGIEQSFRSAANERARLKGPERAAELKRIEDDIAAVDRLMGRHGDAAVEHGLWEMRVLFEKERDAVQSRDAANIELQDAVESLCAIFAWAQGKKLSELSPGAKEYEKPNALTRFVLLGLREIGAENLAGGIWRRINDAIQQARTNNDLPRDMIEHTR